ncbi:hypothetical protein Tco_0789428 [Tanacetum coccineum]
MMADTRTMEELLQAPTEGYGDSISILAILAESFELKHSLLNLVTSKQFCGFEKEDPHAHIHWFNKITLTIKYKYVPNSSIKLMLFPFSIEGAAWIWLEKEPPRFIVTWEDLVSKFINQFFPPFECSSSSSTTQFSTRYQDNIQAYVSAAAINYNQGNAGHRPPSVAYQVRPPGFSPVQNNQNWGNNYNLGNSTYRAPTLPTQAAPSNELAN